MGSTAVADSIKEDLSSDPYVNRKGDGVNFDRLIYKTRTDLSDRTKKLWRYTFQVEIVTFAELVP